MSLQSNAENADRSRETTNSDRFTSVESEINSRFQIPRRWAGEVLPSTATRIVNKNYVLITSSPRYKPPPFILVSLT